MNILKGKITEIQSSDTLSLISVDVDGDTLSAVVLEGKKGILNYKKGELVQVIFKETEVGLAKNLSGLISFRNRFPAKIKKIEKGSVLAKISLDYKNYRIESIISAKSAEEMKLKESDAVEWLVKTNEVSLMTIHNV